MLLPLGIPDPMWLGELCLELGMSVHQLGESMSHYELNVFWPCFMEARNREQQTEDDKRRQSI